MQPRKCTECHGRMAELVMACDSRDLLLWSVNRLWFLMGFARMGSNPIPGIIFWLAGAPVIFPDFLVPLWAIIDCLPYSYIEGIAHLIPRFRPIYK